MRISDWSSDVCSSDLSAASPLRHQTPGKRALYYGLRPGGVKRFRVLRPGVTAAIARAESLPLSPNRAIVFTALQHYKGNILFRVTSTDSIVMALADPQFAEARRYMVPTQLRPTKEIGKAPCRGRVGQI